MLSLGKVGNQPIQATNLHRRSLKVPKRRFVRHAASVAGGGARLVR